MAQQQYIVTEYHVRSKYEVVRTFIGVLSRETLRYFIETKITEYATSTGIVIETKFIKMLVTEAIEASKMSWNVTEDTEAFQYLLIDDITPRELGEEYSLLNFYGPNLKEILDNLRAEVEEKPKHIHKSALPTVEEDDE